tara:strand:- start:45 stop:512 length:468 start_codon:yes stop_codon:yes gene_type:complete
MTNKKNNNENQSTHPEANEDLKVSESIPNSFKELLEVQESHLEITEDPLLIDDIDPEKAKFISLCNSTFKAVIELLYKLKSGPGEDMFVATMLIHRVFHFNKNCLENSNENPNLSEIQIQKLASSNAKLKCLIQILSIEDDCDPEDEWLNFKLNK